MKQILIGVMVFFIGISLLIFATMFGLMIAVSMLIASPFVNRKLQKVKIISQNQDANQAPLNSKKQPGNIIDGDFQDITKKQ